MTVDSDQQHSDHDSEDHTQTEIGLDDSSGFESDADPLRAFETLLVDRFVAVRKISAR